MRQFQMHAVFGRSLPTYLRHGGVIDTPQTSGVEPIDGCQFVNTHMPYGPGVDTTGRTCHLESFTVPVLAWVSRVF